MTFNEDQWLSNFEIAHWIARSDSFLQYRDYLLTAIALLFIAQRPFGRTRLQRIPPNFSGCMDFSWLNFSSKTSIDDILYDFLLFRFSIFLFILFKHKRFCLRWINCISEVFAIDNSTLAALGKLCDSSYQIASWI